MHGVTNTRVASAAFTTSIVLALRLIRRHDSYSGTMLPSNLAALYSVNDLLKPCINSTSARDANSKLGAYEERTET